MLAAALGASVDNKLIISVKEARKLLGKDGLHLSDDQVKLLIVDLTDMSSEQLNEKGSKNSVGDKIKV